MLEGVAASTALMGIGLGSGAGPDDAKGTGSPEGRSLVASTSVEDMTGIGSADDMSTKDCSVYSCTVCRTAVARVNQSVMRRENVGCRRSRYLDFEPLAV